LAVSALWANARLLSAKCGGIGETPHHPHAHTIIINNNNNTNNNKTKEKRSYQETGGRKSGHTAQRKDYNTTHDYNSGRARSQGLAGPFLFINDNK